MAAKNPKKDILKQAREILAIEAEAIGNLKMRLNGDFTKLVKKIACLKGKVIVCGVGKSGLVGAKIAATMSSTGTPAVFLDPLNALHGDLGVVNKGDLLLCLSNSGESVELINVVRSARPLGAYIATLTGNMKSTLARESNAVIDAGVKKEACPLGLAPTASTTAVLAVGDAIAVTVASEKQFTKEQFAARHPAGQLGQRLKLRVRELMRRGKSIPQVSQGATIGDALRAMTKCDNLGVTVITGAGGAISGILTDGDLRRLILNAKGANILHQPIVNVMTRNPKCIAPDAPAVDALRQMELRSITSLLVPDVKGRPAGLILLHDILGRGQFTA